MSFLGKTPRTIGLFRCCLWGAWAVIFLYTAHPVLPDNAIQLPFEQGSPFPRLLPQGWSFFTLDPRSLRTYAYEKDAGVGWIAKPNTPWYGNRFLGFSRAPKLLGVETALLVEALDHPDWTPCDGAAEQCLEASRAAGPVENILQDPKLCGDIGIVKQPPVPWAWSHAQEKVVMPSQILRMSVKCHDNSI